MPLVTAPNESPLSAEHLAVAEAMIAAELGVPMLERETDVGESGTVGSSGLIVLGRPAVSVQSLTLGGAPAAGVLRNVWTLDVSGVVGAGSGGMWGGTVASVLYRVVYTSGWTADDLPAGLRQAILLAATQAAAAATRVGIKSESMGPVSRTFTESGSLSADVLALLRPWRPLRF